MDVASVVIIVVVIVVAVLDIAVLLPFASYYNLQFYKIDFLEVYCLLCNLVMRQRK